MKRYMIPLLISVAIFCMLLPLHAEQHVISKGDSLRVTVLGEPELTKQVLVASDGCITLPLVNEVQLAGMTPSQAAETITTELKRFIRHPQVTVELLEAARIQVTVSGEVRRPGIYTVASTSKLVDVITEAGGYTPDADLSKVTISHAGDVGAAKVIDLSKFLLGGDASVNVLITPGDTILVTTLETAVTGSVMVMGAVRQPGQHSITQGMTLREAVMMAGGPTEHADLSNVTLRHEATGDSIVIDYRLAATGDVAANLELRPGDVIYVSARGQMGFYTIQGAVIRPGQYEIQGNTTITEAIAIAGGSHERARLSNVRILRTIDGDMMTLQANVNDIIDGKTQNVTIHPDDNIYIGARRQDPDYLRILSVAISLGWLITRL